MFGKNKTNELPAPNYAEDGIPKRIGIEELMQAAGTNISDPRIKFEGQLFDGTLAYRDSPIESIDAYKDTVYQEFEVTDVTEYFNGMSLAEVQIALHQVLRLRPEGMPKPVSNDPRRKPGTIRVETGYDWDTGEMQYTTVPHGEMSLPGFRGKTKDWQPVMQVGLAGNTPYIHASVVRVDQDRCQGIFEYVRRWANMHSIYLGQVVDQNFQFVKMTDFKPQNVALSDSHRNAVNLFVRGPLEYTAANDREGLPPKTGLFMYGPPGGGKTMIMGLCGYTTARMGGVSVIVHPESGIDGFNVANERSKRLMLAGHKVCICMEDMENLAEEARATVLDILDGSDAKGLRRIVVGTSNFIERIDRAMLRPGRFDGVEFAGLPDLAAFKQLVHILLDGKDLSGIDFEEAFPHFEGYTFAFMANAVNNVVRAAIIRTKGVEADFVFTTEDLINSAQAVRGHFDLMQEEVVKDDVTIDSLHQQYVDNIVVDRLDERNFSDDVDYGTIGNIVRNRLDETAVHDYHTDEKISYLAES